MTSMQSRDQLMKDVLADTPKEDRRRLVTVCLYSHPQNVDFTDWVILVSVLIQIGIVDLLNGTGLESEGIDCIYFSGDKWMLEVDNDGRIIFLSIDNGPFRPFNLPASIARLKKLTRIWVNHCLSIPVELGNIPNLQELTLWECSELLENFPVEIELKNLKILRVNESRIQSSFLGWITRQLPNLEELDFFEIDDVEENGTKFVLNTLCTEDFCCQDKLKRIVMDRCGLDDKHLATLLFQILPRFRSVSSICLYHNKIESVQSIVDKLKIDKSRVVSKALNALKLDGNPIEKKLQGNDPNEKEAILSFLGNFNTINDIGHGNGHFYGSDVEYALRMNHAGRHIFEGDGSVDSIPLSVWPTILRRASKKPEHIYTDSYELNEKKNPTGLLYLLQRHGPVLVAGTDLTTQ